ncbi:MAG: hypothetical protein WBX09_21155, partial [Terracidiphilus sp.]
MAGKSGGNEDDGGNQKQAVPKQGQRLIGLGEGRTGFHQKGVAIQFEGPPQRPNLLVAGTEFQNRTLGRQRRAGRDIVGRKQHAPGPINPVTLIVGDLQPFAVILQNKLSIHFGYGSRLISGKGVCGEEIV